jgi:class 3 adenylate cyclase/tetratricopeptide (TPR) repeat protein
MQCPTCGEENPDRAKFCSECGSPLTAPPPAGRHVRKTVTIVFCDVTGSTALGERLDPESLRDVQARYFEAMGAVIERHGGTVEKFIGDAVMAVFGIPLLHEDDALRAVRAAAEMREALKGLNKELERDRGVTIQVRIGVNTGEVVAGDDTSKALVTGDAVNVAARLEQHAAPGTVLLGEETHRLVRDAVEAEPVEPLEAKGKSERLAAWRLLSVRPVESAVPRRLDSPMVGRERQLAQLRQAFDAAATDRACQLFTLLGPAGVGKSRLVAEFLEQVSGDATVLRGRCLPYGDGITYFPVIEAIKEAAGLADFDLPDVVETKVCAVLEGDEHQEAVCRHVSQLMGVAEPTAAEETFWAIRRFFEAVARERPLVLVFDDVHWGEPTFLDLVDHVADWSRGSPILLLCVARPDLLDERPAWGGGKMNSATLSLEPLGEDDVEDLVSNLLGRANLPADVVERVVGSAEGNPLFVEQTIAMLIDDGLLVRDGDGWAPAGDLSKISVPPSIQALLSARVDRLTGEERQVLEAAAVVGKEFFAGAVRELVDERLRPAVGTHLMSLVRKELIRPDRSTLPGEDAFRFRHLLVRDAAYEAIPKAERARLHERFADWLETIAGDAVIEQEEIVGYHLEWAHAYRAQLGPVDEAAERLGARAAARLLSAAERASARGDVGAAVKLFQRALASMGEGAPERSTTLWQLGRELRMVGDVRAAFEAFDEAAALAEVAGDRIVLWRARVDRAGTLPMIDPFAMSTDEIRALLDEAIPVFEEASDHHGLVIAWTERANAEWMPCRYARAAGYAREAFRHAVASGDQRLVADSATTLFATDILGPTRPEDGLRTIEEVRPLVEHSRHLQAVMLTSRAILRGVQGGFDEARASFTTALGIVEAIGERFGVAAAHQMWGHVEWWAGDLRAAEAHRRADYEILLTLGDEGHASTSAGHLGRALCLLGRFDEAEPLAAVARSTAAGEDLASQTIGRSVQAMIASARGEHDEAERLGLEAAEMFADAEMPMSVGDAWFDLATIRRTAGRSAEAIEAAERALEQYELKGIRSMIERTRALIDELRT